MKHIKIKKKGWANYNGYLGMVEFKSGVSCHPVERIMTDRIAAVLNVVEIDEFGDEVDTGAAVRIVEGMSLSAPVTAKLPNPNQEQLDQEARDMLPTEKPPGGVLYTSEELQAIGDDKGLKGLRAIGDLWEVRHRSIPGLIAEILDVQKSWKAKVDAKRAKVGLSPQEFAAEGPKMVAAAGGAQVPVEPVAAPVEEEGGRLYKTPEERAAEAAAAVAAIVAEPVVEAPVAEPVVEAPVEAVVEPVVEAPAAVAVGFTETGGEIALEVVTEVAAPAEAAPSEAEEE